MTAIHDADLRFDLSVERRYAHPASRLADKFLHVTLYICVLTSFFVYIEPAPYDYLTVVLGFACVIARVKFSPVIIPLLILLLIRDAAGALGLLQILDDPDSPRFLATSFYLGLTGVMFACLVTEDTVRRMTTLRSAYMMAAVLGSLLGVVGYFDLYFHFYPGLEAFAFENRATGAFKDPNVQACFLVPPVIWLIEGFITDGVRLKNLVASLIIFVGLLLAFSRAAWGTCFVAFILMMYLFFVTQGARLRKRTVVFLAVGTIAVIGLIVVLVSIPAVYEMAVQRARVVEPYDAGYSTARFSLQALSWQEILAHPLGMGPWGFMRVYNWVSHNSYLGTLLNHGWIGGAAYITLITLTLVVGFKSLWLRTPWQTILIATYLALLALILEAFVVDTDHFRHFYLMLGLVWGLSAATVNFQRRQLRSTRDDAYN